MIRASQRAVAPRRANSSAASWRLASVCTTWAQCQYGGGTSPNAPPALQTVGTPRRAASPASARASSVFPMPASPTSRTRPPCPKSASSSAPTSAASCSNRPTSSRSRLALGRGEASSAWVAPAGAEGAVKEPSSACASASASSPALAGRSAGSFASAHAITASTAAGTSRRRALTRGHCASRCAYRTATSESRA